MILQTNLLYLFLSFIFICINLSFLINLLYKFQFREKVREFGPKTHFAFKKLVHHHVWNWIFLVTLILTFF